LAPCTTKGDIIVYNGSDNIRLGVGGDGEYLVADSGETSGLKWAAFSGVSGSGSANRLTYWSGTSTLTSDASFTYGSITSGVAQIGRAEIGQFHGNTNFCFLGHSTLDHSGNASFAIGQSYLGDTYVNAASGKKIYFRINGTDYMIMDNGTLDLDNCAIKDLAFEGSGSFWGIFTHSNSANRTYTFPNATGTVPLGTGTANRITLWSGTSSLSSDTTLTFGSISTGVAQIGRVELGQWHGNTDFCFFGHSQLDHSGAVNFAITQSYLGDTYVNASSGKALYLRINNATQATLNTTELLLEQNLSFESGTGNKMTFDHAATTARTVTFPDAAGTVPLGTGAANRIATWSGTNALSSDSTLTFGSVATGVAEIGKVELGTHQPSSAYCYFGNADISHAAGVNYAVLQDNTGKTFINAASGQTIYFRINR